MAAGVSKKYRKGFLLQLITGVIFFTPKLEGEARNKYIQRCYRTGRVSIILDGGGVAHNVPIDKTLLDVVEFPDNFGEAGDSVLCWLNPYNGKPMVINIFNKEDRATILEEYEQRILKSFGNNLAEIDLKGKTGEIYLNVDSSSSEGGIISININNVDRNGKLKIKVNGESEIYTSKKAKISSNTELEMIVRDLVSGDESSLNITGEKHVFNGAALNSFISDINKLVERYNLIEEDINSLKSIFNNWQPAAQDGGAALKVSASTWYTNNDLKETSVDDIKDPKIEN